MLNHSILAGPLRTLNTSFGPCHPARSSRAWSVSWLTFVTPAMLRTIPWVRLNIGGQEGIKYISRGGKHNRSLFLQIHLAAYLLSGVAFSLYFQTSLVKQVYRGTYPRNTSHCSSAPSQTFSGSVRMPHDQTGSINNSHYGKLDARSRVVIAESWTPGREKPLAVPPRAKQQRPHYVSIPLLKSFKPIEEHYV